jgi:hypothetical protein
MSACTADFVFVINAAGLYILIHMQRLKYRVTKPMLCRTRTRICVVYGRDVLRMTIPGQVVNSHNVALGRSARLCNLLHILCLWLAHDLCDSIDAGANLGSFGVAAVSPHCRCTCTSSRIWDVGETDVNFIKGGDMSMETDNKNKIESETMPAPVIPHSTTIPNCRVTILSSSVRDSAD